MNDNEQPDEYEILRRAVEEGYFKTPREISLVRLSEQLGMTDMETSRELRRTLDQYLRDELLSDTPR